MNLTDIFNNAYNLYCESGEKECVAYLQTFVNLLLSAGDAETMMENIKETYNL